MIENKSVFISYRRSVGAFVARAVYQNLRDHGYNVFMDVESIPNGRFDTRILQEIEHRPHFVAILVPGSVERFAEPGDWMRREIEHAIDTERNIVPLLAKDFDFRDAEPYLTGKLRLIQRHNALYVPHDFFEEAMTRLRLRFLQNSDGEVSPFIDPDELLAEDDTLPYIPETMIIDSAESRDDWEEEEMEPFFPGSRKRAVPRDGDFTLNWFEDVDEFDDVTQYTRPNSLLAPIVRREVPRDDDIMRLQESMSDGEYFDRALSRYSLEGDVDGAIADYTACIHQNPYNAQAYNNRGALYHGEKADYERALADYNAALQVDPYHDLARRNRDLLLNLLRGGSDSGDDQVRR